MQSTIPTLMAETNAAACVAPEILFTTLYSELHRIARRELARRGVGVNLGPTTLVHEVYLEVVTHSGRSFADRGRFIAYAARAMRGLIIDRVRNQHAQKRGGKFEITSISGDVAERTIENRELVPLSDALDELAKMDQSLSEIIDLRFFCGFSFTEIAAMKGLSERTVQRKWYQARIYLHRSIREPALS
jgi:RNA polymerase sigma factor (TIGR02999 family)